MTIDLSTLTSAAGTVTAVAGLIAAGLNAGTLAVEEIASAVEAIYQRIFGTPPTPAESEAILQSDIVQLATLAAREAAQAGGAQTGQAPA